MYSSLSLAVIATTAVAIGLFYFIKSYYLKFEPTLRTKSIGSVFALPIFHLWTFATLFIGLLAFLPDRTSLIDMLASDLAKMGLSEEQWNSMYFYRNLYGIGFITTLGTTAYTFLMLFRKKGNPKSTIVSISIIMSILAAIALIRELAGFSTSFLVLVGLV